MIFAFLVTMSGQSGGRRVQLAKLNEQLTCKLCRGYFIDATTIIECLHSFCRSCIVKYLENNKYCPICEVQVHKSRPLLNIRPDHTLQDIVYKLVPGCYQNEMRCRREFYAKHPELCSQVTSPEARGEPIESHIYSPDESLNLSLEYYSPHPKDLSETSAIKDGTQKSLLRRYLRCPAAVTVFHLQKLIRAKYGLNDTHRVDIMYKEEPLCSSYTLMDVMYIYHWRRKVPLHLSYRIFESSSKRIKLSEDNANYKKSITDAGIDSVELKEEKSLKREWKEVQLKISETGVMSITDISSTVHKRDAGIGNLQDDKTSENTVTSVIEVNKADSLVENCDISKPTEATRPNLVVDAQVAKNPTFPDAGDASSLVTIDVNSTPENSSKSCAPMAQQNGSAARQTNEVGSHTAKSQQDRREGKQHNQAADAKEERTVSQEQTIVRPTVPQGTGENASVDGNKEGNVADKKLSINNNNADFKAEAEKECAKNANETKTGNSGSKIDALSVKLQFQPKMGQVNNTYSKKTPKEKRALQQNTKRSDGKTSLENSAKSVTDVKARTCYGNAMDKVSCSGSTATCSQKSLVSAAAPQNVSATNFSSGEQKVLYEKDQSQSTNIDVQQALDLLEQRTNNSSVQVSSTESVAANRATANTVNQRLQCTLQSSNTMAQTNENSSASTENNESASAAKPMPLKNSDNCASQKLSGTAVSSVATSSASSSVSQSSTQTSSSMTSTTVKNNYSNSSHNATSATAMTTITTTTTTTTTASKPASSGAVPPCPDAIPISLMKQASMRKQEATAKGTNLNELCAKIGSSTIGSKINDICAKIGESSKEKNKLEGRGKLDVPDLLKINTKKSPSLFTSDTAVKHIPNIPNVPVYTPSTSTTVQESKNSKSALPTSTSANLLAVSSVPSSSHVTQRMSLKRHNQPIGYKTLRDPPKSWNPTLSKNNYVAAKNQAKEMQTQIASEGTSKQIPSKPAKIFKMRNMPRYLGNPASGVKPMYGIANDTKEKEQSTTTTKSVTLNMMKIDPKTLSPIVSTVNSPIISPPPFSLNVRSYQNTPFPRDICRNTGSPISPRNSPVNMLSTNPFIPSPTPNTNPRIIYSPFPPPFPDASRFPSPLIRSPIGIPPPSAFHSSLPPSINKLYQRSSYIPQTTGYSPVPGQPPAVQRIPPSTHSSSPKSPKTSSPSSIATFNLGKPESQSPITSTSVDVALLLSKSMPMQSLQRATTEPNAFNLSKTGGSIQTGSIANVVETSPAVSTKKDAVTETQTKQTPSAPRNSASTTSAEVSENLAPPNERKQSKDAADAQKPRETARCKDESSKSIFVDTKSNVEIADNTVSSPDKKEKNQAAKINGDVTTEQFAKAKSKENNNGDETTATAGTTELGGQEERSSSRERNNPKNNAQANVNNSPVNISKNEDLGKTSEQIQGKKSEVQRNKAET